VEYQTAKLSGRACFYKLKDKQGFDPLTFVCGSGIIETSPKRFGSPHLGAPFLVFGVVQEF
jgi:hypothetical protein